MMNAVIIDDEPNNIELLTNLITRFVPQIELAGQATGVAEGFALLTEKKPALVFLDVEMQDGTGFDLLKLVPQIPLKVIFITAHEQYALHAFHYSAIDYLLKPVSPSELLNAVRKAEQSVSNDELKMQINALLSNVHDSEGRNKKIVLKTQERVYVTNSDEIVRLESEGNYTTVYLTNGNKVLVSKLLKEFEETLKDQHHFFRTHQSHIVNLDYFFCYEKSESSVILKDKSNVPLAVRKKEQLFKILNLE
ncbi:MAG: LytTR family DNA-binding domain-containing protein [Bacteroidia bacterium]|jgi:two-component system LytT family response regulator|nr:LytTR family DNA-binding domain-containing protein [Bacteroidia bacterium]